METLYNSIITPLMQIIVYPLKEMLVQVTGFLPALISTFVILIIGIWVSGIIRDLVHGLLKKIGLDKISDSVGLSDLLRKGGVKHTISGLITISVYLIFIVMFAFMTVKSLGLTMMTDTVYRLMGYVPHVLAAVIVLVLGIILAHAVGRFVLFVAHNTHMPNPKLFDRISRWTIILFAANVALEEIGYGSLLVGKTFDILFMGVVFAYALAFGLGGKDAAAKYLDRKFKK